jgi:FKBP-type peptidyl-prolyl cis-trans isomerase FkpA
LTGQNFKRKSKQDSNMRQFFLLAFVTATIISGCGNADYERTNDGLYYRIIKSGKGDYIKPRTYLKINQSAEMGDTVFFSTFGTMATYGYFDSLTTPSHEFLDILDQMRIGDSAIVIRSVDTLVKRGVAQYNSRLKKGTSIKVKIKILGLYASEEDFNTAKTKDMEEYKQNEVKFLEAYIKEKDEKGINKLPEGIFVKIEKEGTGIKVDSGMMVKVKYSGKLLDGTMFDSNLDSTFGHPEPFEFIVGGRQVIEGWDIGVKTLKVGSKAKIFIPSLLGYGMQGSPPKIPPYSNLVFEVEVLSAGVPQVANKENPPHDANHTEGH